MRLWLYRVLLVGLWLAGMLLIMSALVDGMYNTITMLMLLSGAFIASTATVALAEEVRCA